MKLKVKKCEFEDLDNLCRISRVTYDDTFKDVNTPSNMKAYLKKAFNKIKLRNELADLNSLFYFLYADGKLAGYSKINDFKAQTDIHDPKSLEIERFYVLKEYHGKGLGLFLINMMINIAIEREKSYVWLGVWESNTRALNFYRKSSFYVIGKHPFIMGDDEQTDLIMRKDLN